ncbi:radical SAM family heme chaperone HemW [uncultured Intestinimonas sp.]|uniref:radical SAM family heme chaperone HemW n=1 Tax=uncultured Intestinimonas sp. TaxID=1689265 RepID=UPI0025E5ED16|nr:radical SAM family heme chaperone HemW [uncultured Intestinimonas sp.]
MARQLGLYIHIPFCRCKCDYCDFYSLAGREERMDACQKALLTHIKETAPQAKGYVVDTIYFGGGTPSLYGPKRVKELLSCIRRRFEVAGNAEITLEANPDSADKKRMRAYRRAGVNRVSLGMQSAHDDELSALHRPHTFQQVQEAVEAIRGARIKNLTLDLIYGLPGQDMARWRDSVEKALALRPEHLSCYGLKVEEGTPLQARVDRGERLPDDDLQADMYLWMVARLEAAGYHQYEISNFARPGFQSRHNLKYWLTRPYLGFGPGAHSDFGGRRFSFLRDLDGYIDGVLGGKPILDSDDLIPKRERSGEYLMLRLRTTRGIEEWEYRREYFMNFDPVEAKLAEYEQNGWAARVGQRWRLTPVGFLLSNQLIGELLERQESATLETTLPKVQKNPPPPGPAPGGEAR